MNRRQTQNRFDAVKHHILHRCLNTQSLRTDSSRLSPLTGMQAGIGGCHLPWWHLDTRTLMWYPGSQNKWIELFWGKPRHGDGSQRKPPCSGTRGWVQLFSRPAEAQMRTEGDVNHLYYSLAFIFLTIKTAFPIKPSSFFLLLQLCSTSPHASVFFWLWEEAETFCRSFTRSFFLPSTSCHWQKLWQI